MLISERLVVAGNEHLAKESHTWPQPQRTLAPQTSVNPEIISDAEPPQHDSESVSEDLLLYAKVTTYQHMLKAVMWHSYHRDQSLES